MKKYLSLINTASNKIIFATFILCIIGEFYIARSIKPLADAMQSINELDSVFSGNLLLQNWVLASDNFYATDLPFYIIARCFVGRQLWLIYAVPTLTFALLLVASVVLVVRTRRHDVPAWPGILIVMYLIGLPFQPGAAMLLISDFHVATVMYCLFALILIQPLLDGGSISRFSLAFFTVLLFLAEASDPFAEFFFGGPLIGLVLLRFILFRRVRLEEIILLGCTTVATLWAMNFTVFFNYAHQFIMRPSFSAEMIRDDKILFNNISAVTAALRILFNAQTVGLEGIWGIHVMAITKLAAECVVLGAAGLVLLITHKSENSGTEQLLVLAGACLISADILSQAFTHAVGFGAGFPGAATRYVVPTFIFFSITAAIVLQNMNIFVKYPRIRRIASVVGFAFLAVFVVCAAQSLVKASREASGIESAPERRLAQWLSLNHFRYGVGDYYTTQVVRALSGQAVMADPVMVDKGAIVPRRFWTDTVRFDANVRPQFLIYPPHNVFGLDRAAAEKTYGKPLRIFNIEGYNIFVINPQNKRGMPRDLSKG